MSDVPCYRLKELPLPTIKVAARICGGGLFLCLSTMVVYTCRKGSKEKFTYKLVSYYLISMAVTLFLAGTARFLPKYQLAVFRHIVFFSFLSTFLWLNAVGFQIWSDFKASNLQDNARKDRRHLIFYFIYVWGISAILTSLNSLEEEYGDFWMGHWVQFWFPCYNLLVFLILSVNICITRCAVIHLTTEENFKRQLAYVVLRLCLMMGIPRMLLLLLHKPLHGGSFSVVFFVILEPFVIFVVLLWKSKGCCNWKFLCCCCRKSEEISDAAEVIEIHTSRK